MPISNFRDSGPPIDEQAIVRLEKRLEIHFPADYCAFLLRTNGGRPYPEDTFNDELGRVAKGSTISEFYAVERETISGTLLQGYLAYRTRIPRDLLPIGFDLGGSRICIGIGPNNHGQIFFWAMEDEVDEGQMPDYSNVWRLAKTFDEFIEGFYDYDLVEE